LSPGVNSTATSTVGNASWRDIFIAGAGGIANEGTNTVAVHALNASLGSSDFSIDLELARPRLDYGQVEAPRGDDFLPDASPDSNPEVGDEFQGAGPFSHKIFEIRSVAPGLGYGTSIHAANVATFSYRYSSYPGFFLTHIKAWEAENFLGPGLLRSGSSPPDASLTQVQNHSWIGTTQDFPAPELNNMIRRFDFMASRDRTLCAVGLNNGSTTAVPEIWGCSYNSIVVGRTDGGHSRGGTVTGVDGAGRTKPDIVSPGTGAATSYSTANVSGMAALLLGHAYDHPELSQVFHPEVNKAIIMAGATKEAGWSNTSSQPLDPVYGAGTANILDSFHLLTAGQHSSGATVPASGWDYAELGAAAASTYTFTIPDEEVARSSSIVLTWFRQFEENPSSNNFSSLPVLPDFELRLYESEGGVPGSQIALSDSAVDNAEHIYLEALPAGEYTITVQTDTSSPYAIAWDNQLSGVPQVVIDSTTPGAGAISLDLTNLVVGEVYTLQYSTNLTQWDDLYTVSASAESEPFTQLAVPTGSRKGFYRIVWSP
ncbi:MAG: S8 family serine peptidase, partial [Verrucomicrobiales bacterium]